jgi:predicted peptidase
MRLRLFLSTLGLLLLSWLPGAHASAADARHFVERRVTVEGTTYRYQVFVPDGWTAKRAWPVVLFLHGSGEAGSDNAKQMTQGLPPWLREHGASFPAVVVIPQAPEHTYWNGPIERMALQAMQDSIAEFHGDRHRLYLTGLSMGGFGAWQIAIDHPHLFAAAAIICGAINPIDDEPALHVLGIPAGVNSYAWVAAHVGGLPVWIFHGGADTVVPLTDDHRLYPALQAARDEVRYTEFPGVNHGSWVPAYALPELWPWMFSHRLASVRGALKN